MPDCLSSKTVKTRKPHRCFGCREMIPAGTQALANVNVDGGSIYTLYFCETCAEWFKNECVGCSKCDPWGDGVFEGDILACRQYGKLS